MTTLAALLILAICGYALRSEYRRHRIRRTKELHERSKRMKNGWDRLQGKIDREICEAIYRLPESEVADD